MHLGAMAGESNLSLTYCDELYPFWILDLWPTNFISFGPMADELNPSCTGANVNTLGTAEGAT